MARVKVENDSTVKQKVRKRRKPMSDEQKAAAAERLRLAREKRMAANPPEYKSVHPEVLKHPEDHPWHHLKVKQWIKTQKDLLAAEKRNVKSDVKGALAKAHAIEGYIRNMETYLRTGTWVDLFWGEYGQNKCKSVCLVMAYDKDGNPKRNVGTFYSDIGCEWTKEMDLEYRGIKNR